LRQAFPDFEAHCAPLLAPTPTAPVPPPTIEAQILAVLKARAPEGCTQRQGADAIGKKHESTTQAWSRLLKKGLVRKEGALYFSVAQKEAP